MRWWTLRCEDCLIRRYRKALEPKVACHTTSVGMTHTAVAVQPATRLMSRGPMNESPSAGSSDDVEGLYNLYGPTCQIEPVSTEFRGGTNPDDPFEVCFETPLEATFDRLPRP